MDLPVIGQKHFDGELLYAEVKHFRWKVLDTLDEAAMRTADPRGLVRYGDLAKTEGREAWKQILDVATKKAAQCIEGAPNILVIENSSICLELMASSGAHAIDEACESGVVELRRLNGICSSTHPGGQGSEKQRSNSVGRLARLFRSVAICIVHWMRSSHSLRRTL